MEGDRKFIQEKGENSTRKAQSLSSQQQLFFNIEHPSKRVQCDICRRNISKEARAVAPSDNNIQDYCIACFSNLDPFPDSYFIVNKLDYPLLDSTWSAGEQLLLLEGLQNFGFGNWNGISQFMGSKTNDQIEEHYHNLYLQSLQFIPSQDILAHRDSQGLLVHPPLQHVKGQEKVSVAWQSKEPKGGSQPGQIIPTSEVVGFMPKRGDFQTEYDNDAELLLAEMQFNDDDTEEEKAMKFRLMDIYNHKLTQRIKRKKFVIERKLLDLKEQNRLDKTRTKEEKEIYNLMKVVARFNTPEDHEKLVQGIIREKQIRQRIAELKELESRGIKNLEEIEEELEGKRKKERKREGDSYTDKSKTRRIPRKDNAEQRSDKKVLYISKEEEELCQKLNMTFKQYTAIKETILREAIKMGLLSRDRTTEQLKVCRTAAEAVFDFVVEQEGLQTEEKSSRGNVMKQQC